MRIKLVVFDLFDTILDKVWFNYDLVLDTLHRQYFNQYDKECLVRWADQFRNENMLDRDITNVESSFIDQLRFYEIISGVRYDRDYTEVEWDVFRACRDEKVGVHVIETLDYLKSKEYKLAVLSNSIFSAKCLDRYLKSFNLSDYFDKVYSSADLKVRKPSSESFRHVCQDFGADPAEVWFVGNNLEKDYEGAMNAGLRPVLYDRTGRSHADHTIHDLLEIKMIMG